MQFRPATRLMDNAYLLLILTAAFWSGNFVVGRGIHDTVPPITLAWCRWMIAFLIVFPFALRYLRQDWPALKANAGILILLGIMGIGCFNSFAYIGLNDTTALNALVLQSSGPVFIAMATFICFGDRISRRQALGILISLTGALVIVARGDPGRLTALELNKGDAWIVAAFVTWAIYTAFLRMRPNIHTLSFLAVTFFVGITANTPFLVMEHLAGARMQPTVGAALAILYVAIFPGLVAYIFYNRGVELIGANRAAPFLHLVVLFGALLAIVLLGESLELYHVIGMALILPGVSLAARKP
ncbi:MAG: DMT family transporter [Hyphomicrobiales bacterium]|nr:DMT family transporter [Hyphomicrobiales bacterium]